MFDALFAPTEGLGRRGAGVPPVEEVAAEAAAEMALAAATWYDWRVSLCVEGVVKGCWGPGPGAGSGVGGGWWDSEVGGSYWEVAEWYGAVSCAIG